MSHRTSIIKALSEKLKQIDGTGTYKSNIFGQAHPYLRFWDECNSFPAIYMSPGSEAREYHPGGFKWGFLGVSIKIYTKGEDAAQLLEYILEDVENVIDANYNLVYDVANGYETTEVLIQSITTDEGLLAPYGIGEINLQVRYAIV